jgi:drug/metabolite transporter (DMT)-like permease
VRERGGGADAGGRDAGGGPAASRARIRSAGTLAVSAAAVLWAFGGTYARRLIDAGASAREITEARAWIAAVGIGVLVLTRRRPRTGHAPLWIVIAFGLSIASANYTYYLAIASLPVAVAIVTQYTAPALVVLWKALVERTPPSRRVLGALTLALGGVAFLAELPRLASAGGLRVSPGGLAAAFASAIAFSAYMLTGERMRRAYSPEAAMFRGFGIAGVFWIVVQATHGRPATLLQARFVPGVIVIGVATTIAPFLLFIWGLGAIGASRAAIASTLEPVSATVIAWVWLSQSLTVAQVIGAVMIVGGVVMVQSERPTAVPSPAPLE